MTASIDSLRGRVAQLRKHLAKQGAPRSWCLHMENAEEIPAAIVKKIRPEDEVIIREYPREFFGDLVHHVDPSCGCSCGHVIAPGGAFIVWPDGRLEKAVKH